MDKTDSFKPNETVYVSVTTEGSAPSAVARVPPTFAVGGTRPPPAAPS